MSLGVGQASFAPQPPLVLWPPLEHDTTPLEVRVTLRDLSDDVIAKLEALGFKLLAKATTVKLVIGTIPADKLEELALLKAVRSVDPGK